MKYLYFILLITIPELLHAQTLIDNSITWKPSSSDARLSFSFISKGVMPGPVEFAELTINNHSNHELVIKVSYTITDNCGKTRNFTKGLTLEPQSSSLSRGATNTGIDYSSPCETLTKFRHDRTTKIDNVTVSIILIEDLTAKEIAYKEKQAAAAKEKIANESKVRAENPPPIPTGSYYSNQPTGTARNSNAEVKKPTWQETNAKIQAENQQKYLAQRAQIAENNRINKEAGDQLVNSATEIAGMIGNMVNDAKEKKEKEAAKKRELEEEREAAKLAETERLNEIARKKALRLELRNSFFSEFPEGGVPLSSQNILAAQLYYFTYVSDRTKISGENPVIALSNIFVINRYADGTWPLKASILSDIRKLNEPGTITLVGYFTTRELAEEMRNSLVDLAGRSDFALKNITYKGKTTSATAKDNTDFWGKKVNPDSLGRANLRITKGDEDFWETGKAKKKAAEEKKEEEKKPTKKDNFWKN